MKKIRLNVANLDATEILSRDQLKSIFGGSGSGSESPAVSCTYSLDCSIIAGIKDNSTVSCTSTIGDCSWIKNIFDVKIGVKCENQEFKCK